MISKQRFPCYIPLTLSALTYKSHSNVSKPKQGTKINPLNLEFKTSEKIVSLCLSYLSPFYNRNCKIYNCNYINLGKDGTTLILIIANKNELCVISHRMEKTNQDILSIVPFPEQFKSNEKLRSFM